MLRKCLMKRDENMSEKIGFIGLGVMGAPMARNLTSKYDVIVFDIDNARMGLVPKARKAENIGEVGSSAETVLLSLPSSDIVKEVVLGTGGLMQNMRRGSTIIDASTTLPDITQEISHTLKKMAGIFFLDAPVSGGEKAAIEGNLSVMVGGEQEAFEKSLEILHTIGTSVVRMGESGMGEITKLVNNLIVGITFVAVAEGFALGTKSGLNPKVLYEAIRNGWAGSKVLDVSAEAILPRNFKPGGTVNIHWKDLGYALELARKKDVPVPATALAHEIFKAARASGIGHLSQPAIVNLWEDLLKIVIKE
ncbi:NAD(P)-binding domain-containing protein [Candidatus Bathyarchaeota archaeon]|nr:NAD(P)-binding domain-containing protein [Candidatus Bathyarchaeota archaeon]